MKMISVIEFLSVILCCCLCLTYGADIYNKPPNIEDFSLENKDFSILAMSTSDVNSNPKSKSNYWYRWLSNRYYRDSKLEKYPKGINDMSWNDGSICQLRFFGVTEANKLHGDYYSGIGSLSLSDNNRNIIGLKSHVPCYYNSLKGNWIEQKDFLRFSVYCPILVEQLDSPSLSLLYDAFKANRGTHNNREALKGSSFNIEFCDNFHHHRLLYDMRLYSSSIETNQTFNKVPDTDANEIFFNNVNINNIVGECPVKSFDNRMYNATAADLVKSNSIYTQFKPYDIFNGNLPSNSIPNNVADSIVCTVQTFTSPITGPNMYLFTKYHSMLGFTVVLYDRFATHYEFIKDLIEPYGVIYHGYTPLELIQPYIYNQEYFRRQGTKFKYYYLRDKAYDGNSDNSSVPQVVHDVEHQDEDKMLAFDMTRVRFKLKYKLLMLDADELLAPTSMRPQPITAEGTMGKAGPGPNHTMSTLRDWFAVHFNSPMYTSGAQEIHYQRWAVAAKVQGGHVHLREPTLDGNVVGSVSECVSAGYASRSLSKMLHCWGDVMKSQPFLKFMDNSGVCPFHWIHRACFKYYWTKRESDMTPAYLVTHMQATEPKHGCFCGKPKVSMDWDVFIVHMSHFQFCSLSKFWSKYTRGILYQQGSNVLASLLEASNE